MIRLGLLISILAVGSCATSSGSPGNEEDNYSRAANSWVDADIREMMAAWGHPNIRYRPPKGGKDGMARWKHFSGYHSTGDSRGADTGLHTYNYYCETVAHFNSACTIKNIDVKRSSFCDGPFEDDFESMTRQKAMPSHAVGKSEDCTTKISPTGKE